MERPFKVGDRIKPTRGFAPNATVVEITERGFKYEYDEVWNIHPRLGLSISEGEDFTDTYPEYPRWELLDDDYSKKAALPFLYCSTS